MKPGCSGGSHGVSAMVSTSANAGPCQHARVQSSTAWASPAICASTEQSNKFRTQPIKPRFRAVTTSQSRYPTPWTRPVMISCLATTGSLTEDRVQETFWSAHRGCRISAPLLVGGLRFRRGTRIAEAAECEGRRADINRVVDTELAGDAAE